MSESDGGESLAPHVSRELEAVGRVDDVVESPSVADAVTPAPPPAATPTAVTPPATPAPTGEATLEGDEIIIEVGD